MSEGSSLIPQLIATLGGDFIEIIVNIILNISLATLGAFALGNVIAWPATAILQIGDEDQIELSTEMESQVAAIGMIGSAVVPIIAGWRIRKGENSFDFCFI